MTVLFSAGNDRIAEDTARPMAFSLSGDTPASAGDTDFLNQRDPEQIRSCATSKNSIVVGAMMKPTPVLPVNKS